jgi:hypothetical protein
MRYEMTSPRPGHRRGVQIVEGALALSAMLFVMTAIIDLGLAVVQYNYLGHACRTLARSVALRGADSPVAATVLGPAAIAGHAADGSVPAQVVASLLPTMTLPATAFNISWPDGDNGPGDSVRVVMTYTHAPLIPGFSPWGSLSLSAESTMRIVN